MLPTTTHQVKRPSLITCRSDAARPRGPGHPTSEARAANKRQSRPTACAARLDDPMIPFSCWEKLSIIGERMKLFTAIYDDARLLGHFLRHYDQAGVTEYFIAVAPEFVHGVETYKSAFAITVYEGLDVADSWVGGASAVSAMRDTHHADDEWAVIADLDEFIEFSPSISSIVQFAETEGANVVRGIMYDRFSADGRLIDFGPAAELSKVYPVRSRLTRDLMGGWDFKGVLVKGKLKPPPDSGHHLFVGEKICSQELEISHYKWNARAIERVRAAYEALTKAGKGWAIEYRQVLDHYDRNGRFAWEEFGGELVVDR
jgi:hypothetical protein